MLTVLLDACVLYPAPLRDYLLNLADADLFQPRWSKEINQEWLRNLIQNRGDLEREKLEKTINVMNMAFPYANITDYEPLIEILVLPDPNDRHVLAAAIKAKVERIITANLKDFPTDYIKQFSISIQHPDNFVLDLINANQEGALLAFERQVQKLKNPPKTVVEVLETLRKCGLKRSVDRLSALLQD